MKNQTENPNTEINPVIFDHNLAIKASQELSQEIFKENLFAKVLNLSTDILNATKVILLLSEDNSLNINLVNFNPPQSIHKKQIIIVNYRFFKK